MWMMLRRGWRMRLRAEGSERRIVTVVEATIVRASHTLVKTCYSEGNCLGEGGDVRIYLKYISSPSGLIIPAGRAKHSGAQKAPQLKTQPPSSVNITILWKFSSDNSNRTY